MSRKLPMLTLFVPGALIIAALFAGCNRNANNTATTQSPAASSPTKPANEPTPRSSFERDLQYVRNSQFTYVWVFSRKDGRPLDKEDAAYLRTTAPQVVD